MKKELILRSLEILKLEFPYALVMAMFYNILFDIPSLIILFVIMGFILQVIVYSRGAELIRSGSIQQSNFEKFRTFFGDFFLITLIMFFPLAVLAMTLGEKQTGVIYGLEGIISVITIYVGPFLFLNRTGVKSIKLGITYFFTHPAASFLLVILTAIPWGINLALKPMILPEGEKLKTDFTTLITGYGISLVTVCFGLAVFYMACMVLVRDGSSGPEAE